MKKYLIRTLKITGIVLGALLTFLIIFPMVYPEYVTEKIKKLANDNLNGEINFSRAKLSFFSHFPALTLNLENFLLKGSEPFAQDTLVSVKRIDLGIDVPSLLFSKKIDIEAIYLKEPFINIQVNKQGGASYNVYKSSGEETENAESDDTRLKLQRIDIKNAKLIYDDKSTDIYIKATGFNYLGKGDLAESIFDLKTKADIASLDFLFGREAYLKNKHVKAELITQINTNSLAFIFQQNDLLINRLPVDFKGKLDFLSNGYDMDFTINAKDCALDDVFTALPPQFMQWHKKATLTGRTDLYFAMKGQYIASQSLSPDIELKMRIRDASVAYEGVPAKAEHIQLNLSTRLPSLDVNKLQVTLDSLYFDIGKEYFSGKLQLDGLQPPVIDARVRAKVDLAKVMQLTGQNDYQLRGMLLANLTAKGRYEPEQRLFPVTKGTLNFTEGYVKTPYYPHPITNIAFKGDISNNDGTMKSLVVHLTPATFTFEGEPFTLNASLENFDDIRYDIDAKGVLNIAKIYHVFHQKGLELEGYARADLSLKGTQSDATAGRYHLLQNKGVVELRNIKTTTEYLPLPFVIQQGVFRFHQDDMHFTNFRATYGQSDFVMNGRMQNAINFALTKGQVLRGTFSLSSQHINVDEFMAQETESREQRVESGEQREVNKEQSSKGVVIVPKDFDFNLNANLKNVFFQGLTVHNLRGNTRLRKGVLALNNVGFNIIGVSAHINASYGDETPERAHFAFKVDAENFDVQRAYKEVKLFREMVTMAKDAYGIISVKYNLKGKLDGEMTPIYPSLEGGGTLSVKDVKLKGFKLFNIISQKAGTDALKDANLTTIDINSTIKNNLITIERFKFKVSGFRPRIEGQTSFDGALNLKMRLGLPPLGIIGIPIKVTGTTEHPKIGLGRKSKDLEETEYDSRTGNEGETDKSTK